MASADLLTLWQVDKIKQVRMDNKLMLMDHTKRFLVLWVMTFRTVLTALIFSPLGSRNGASVVSHVSAMEVGENGGGMS